MHLVWDEIAFLATDDLRQASMGLPRVSGRDLPNANGEAMSTEHKPGCAALIALPTYPMQYQNCDCGSPPVAPEPTADTAAEPEVPAGSLVLLRHVDGHLASVQKHMSDYGDYFLWSGCEWRWWASNGYAVIGVFEPGAVPAAVPSPEPPAAAAAEPGPVSEWWIGDGPLVGPGFLKRWGPFVSRDLALDMRRFIERDTCSTYSVREFPPAASQEPGETR